MKRSFFILLCFFFFISDGFGAVLGTVKDNNNGEKGYLLINSGELNGKNNDIGVWTSPNEWIEQYKGILKGDTGAQGIQGIKGDNGNDGLNGIDGVNGKDGQDGQDGDDFDPVEVNRLDNRIDTTNTNINAIDSNQTSWNKKQDTQLSNHDKRIKNNENKINDLDNRVEDLEKTQTIIEGEIRILDTRKWEVKTFISYSETRNQFDRVGLRFTYKIGKSYEEKKIEELEARLRKAGL